MKQQEQVENWSKKKVLSKQEQKELIEMLDARPDQTKATVKPPERMGTRTCKAISPDHTGDLEKTSTDHFIKTVSGQDGKE